MVPEAAMRPTAAFLTAILAPSAAAQTARAINRDVYLDRLHAMWLGEVIANWTGLQTEGARIEPPFFTDADWGTTPPGFPHPLGFIADLDPWPADDNTDVEYV